MEWVKFRGNIIKERLSLTKKCKAQPEFIEGYFPTQSLQNIL